MALTQEQIAKLKHDHQEALQELNENAKILAAEWIYSQGKFHELSQEALAKHIEDTDDINVTTLYHHYNELIQKVAPKVTVSLKDVLTSFLLAFELLNETHSFNEDVFRTLIERELITHAESVLDNTAEEEVDLSTFWDDEPSDTADLNRTTPVQAASSAAFDRGDLLKSYQVDSDVEAQVSPALFTATTSSSSNADSSSSSTVITEEKDAVLQDTYNPGSTNRPQSPTIRLDETDEDSDSEHEEKAVEKEKRHSSSSFTTLEDVEHGANSVTVSYGDEVLGVSSKVEAHQKTSASIPTLEDGVEIEEDHEDEDEYEDDKLSQKSGSSSENQSHPVDEGEIEFDDEDEDEDDELSQKSGSDKIDHLAVDKIVSQQANQANQSSLSSAGNQNNRHDLLEIEVVDDEEDVRKALVTHRRQDLYSSSQLDARHAGALLKNRPPLKKQYRDNPQHFLLGVEMQTLGAFIAVVGIVVMAVAYVAFNASTLGLGLGVSALLVGGGIFALGSMKKAESNKLEPTAADEDDNLSKYYKMS